MALRRRRVEAELTELIRTELAAIRSQTQATLAETAFVLSAQMRTEIEERMGEPEALMAGIQGIRAGIVGRDSELVHTLKRVVDTCETLAERVQIDRVERTELVDAISRLATAVAMSDAIALGPSPPFARETIIGGSVDPVMPGAPPEPFVAVEVHDEIDLEAMARESEPTPPPAGRPVRPDGVEVRCRFGDRWVTGFEVCEVIKSEDVNRYRLRRRSDGSVIPKLFDEKDLRFFSTPFVEP